MHLNSQSNLICNNITGVRNMFASEHLKSEL